MNNLKDIDSKIRKIRQAIVNNLNDDFTAIDVNIDEKLSNQLDELLKLRKSLQLNKIDTLSDMYLKLYA